MSQWVYEMSNEQLVNEFLKICADAGRAVSGSFGPAGPGPYIAAEAHYLKGVILSRLDGQKPPFKQREVVETIVDVHSYRTRELKKGERLIVERIYYKDQIWFVALRGIEDRNKEATPPLFEAKNFKSVTV